MWSPQLGQRVAAAVVRAVCLGLAVVGRGRARHLWTRPAAVACGASLHGYHATGCTRLRDVSSSDVAVAAAWSCLAIRAHAMQWSHIWHAHLACESAISAFAALVMSLGCGGKQRDVGIDASPPPRDAAAPKDATLEVEASSTHDDGASTAKCHVSGGAIIDSSPTGPDCTCYSRHGMPLCGPPESCETACPVALTCCTVTEYDDGTSLCECVYGLSPTMCFARAAAIGGTVRPSCP